MTTERTRLAAMLENRVRKRSKHLRKWAKRQGTDCYRIYDNDIPELALTVERFGDHVRVAFEADRGSVQDDPDPGAWRGVMLDAIRAGIDPPKDSRFFIKIRQRQRGTRQYTKRSGKPFVTSVHEGDAVFEVDLTTYLDTGLFLDHRLTRGRVRALADGRRFLNLFAYTGSFTVHAALGGALNTTTVDLSQTYIDWTERNLVANGLEDISSVDERSPGRTLKTLANTPKRRSDGPRSGPSHVLWRGDVMRFVDEAAQMGVRWDLIVVDPPTFSNSKRMEDIFDVQRDHGSLLQAIARVTAPGGIAFFSTNRRKFKLAEDDIGPWTAEDLAETTVPEDFRGRPHRCWRLLRTD